MGKMKHKWMAMLVVLVTTVVTAQEAVKQYDDLKAQAGAWATSRLWASLLNSSAPEEKSLEAQPATCSVKETPNNPSQETWTPGQVIVIKGFKDQQRDAASQPIRIELSALEDKHHNDPGEAAADKFEHLGEVALLSEQPGGEAEERSQPEALTAEPETVTDDAADEDSINHAERNQAERDVHAVSRISNRAVVEGVAPVFDSPALVQETRAAFETQARLRVIRRAAKALLDNAERGKRIELRILRRGNPADRPSPASISLRAENSYGPQATDFHDALPAQPVAQPDAGLSPVGTCASEE
jgi:hypothetical protein